MDPFATITEMVDSAGHKADTLLEAEVKEEPKQENITEAIAEVKKRTWKARNGR